MSVFTLDAEIVVESNRSSSTAEAPARLGSPSPLARRQPADSLLWGFDEPKERARFDRIQRRLIRLEAALFEEFGTRINPSSRGCLLRLFVAFPTVRAPLISAQPDGILTATWRRDGGEELAIKCVSEGLIHYAFASRSPGNLLTLNRQWGTYHNPSLFLTENPVARRIAV